MNKCITQSAHLYKKLICLKNSYDYLKIFKIKGYLLSNKPSKRKINAKKNIINKTSDNEKNMVKTNFLK